MVCSVHTLFRIKCYPPTIIFTIFQNFLYNKNILFSTFFLGCHFQELFTCLFQILTKFSLIFEISDPRLALSLLKSLPRFWLVLGQPFYLEKPELWPYDLCWEITLDAPRPYFKLEPLWIGARDNIFRSSFPMDGVVFFLGFKNCTFCCWNMSRIFCFISKSSFLTNFNFN